MDWKKEAVDKLRSYESMQNALVSIPLELRSLEADSTSIRSGIAKLTDRSGNRREDILLNNLVKRGELEDRMERIGMWVRHMDTALAALEPADKILLTELFIHNATGSVDRVCQRLGIERSSAYRQRDRALQRFTQNLYGCIDS